MESRGYLNVRLTQSIDGDYVGGESPTTSGYFRRNSRNICGDYVEDNPFAVSNFRLAFRTRISIDEYREICYMQI